MEIQKLEDKLLHVYCAYRDSHTNIPDNWVIVAYQKLFNGKQLYKIWGISIKTSPDKGEHYTQLVDIINENIDPAYPMSTTIELAYEYAIQDILFKLRKKAEKLADDHQKARDRQKQAEDEMARQISLVENYLVEKD